jgi:cytochrome c556
MKVRLVVSGLALVAAMASVAAVAQEKKATGVVAVRQNAMKANGGHTGAIRAILTEKPELIEQVVVHANAIAEVAPLIPAMFPEGSTQEPTWALPVIWERKDEFDQHAKELQTLAGKLAETAKGGDVQATLAAFATMGKQGCGGCHDTFRKKDQ